MQKQDREILKIFQTEDNRKIEEDFASMLSENPNLRLFFINENEAKTKSPHKPAITLDFCTLPHKIFSKAKDNLFLYPELKFFNLL